MRTSNFIFCILLLFTPTLFGFKTDGNRIVWSEDRDLRWSDFQGQPDFNDDFRDAVTTSAIKFTSRCNNNGLLEFEVSAEFLKNRSWVKPVAFSDYHLRHEQLHFDITEVYVRKIRTLLSQRNFACNEQALVQNYVQQIMNTCTEAQAKYDKETRYSLHKANQATWQLIVDEQLYGLQKYSAQRFNHK